MYFYNISLNLENNYFKVTDSTNVEKIITLLMEIIHLLH